MARRKSKNVLKIIDLVKNGMLSKVLHIEGVHRKISDYYNSTQGFLNGMKVRNWLADQSYETQYHFGLDVLKMLGGL